MQEQSPMTPSNQLAKDKPQHDLSRRQFLGLLSTGATASVGFLGTASAQETSVISMGNTYFDPIGLHVEPGTTVQFEIEAGSHSATAYEGRIPSKATPFDSGVISTGKFGQTFDRRERTITTVSRTNQWGWSDESSSVSQAAR